MNCGKILRVRAPAIQRIRMDCPNLNLCFKEKQPSLQVLGRALGGGGKGAGCLWLASLWTKDLRAEGKDRIRLVGEKGWEEEATQSLSP